MLFKGMEKRGLVIVLAALLLGLIYIAPAEAVCPDPGCNCNEVATDTSYDDGEYYQQFTITCQPKQVSCSGGQTLVTSPGCRCVGSWCGTQSGGLPIQYNYGVGNFPNAKCYDGPYCCVPQDLWHDNDGDTYGGTFFSSAYCPSQYPARATQGEDCNDNNAGVWTCAQADPSIGASAACFNSEYNGINACSTAGFGCADNAETCRQCSANYGMDWRTIDDPADPNCNVAGLDVNPPILGNEESFGGKMQNNKLIGALVPEAKLAECSTVPEWSCYPDYNAVSAFTNSVQYSHQITNAGAPSTTSRNYFSPTEAAYVCDTGYVYSGGQCKPLRNSACNTAVGCYDTSNDYCSTQDNNGNSVAPHCCATGNYWNGVACTGLAQCSCNIPLTDFIRYIGDSNCVSGGSCCCTFTGVYGTGTVQISRPIQPNEFI